MLDSTQLASAVFQHSLNLVRKYNDCHDESGQFCSGGGEGGDPSKASAASRAESAIDDLDQSEIDAIKMYSSSMYTVINHFARTGKVDSTSEDVRIRVTTMMQQAVSKLDSALARHSIQSEFGYKVLYRGLQTKTNPAELYGKVVPLGAFTSTTSNIKVAEDYAGKREYMRQVGREPVLFRIKVMNGTPALNISKHSGYQSESETLLGRHAVMKVENIYKTKTGMWFAQAVVYPSAEVVKSEFGIVLKYNDCHDDQGKFCETGGDGSGAGPKPSQDKGEQKIGTGGSGFLGKSGFTTYKGALKGTFVSDHPDHGKLKFDKNGNWVFVNKAGNPIGSGPGLESLKSWSKTTSWGQYGTGTITITTKPEPPVSTPKEIPAYRPIETPSVPTGPVTSWTTLSDLTDKEELALKDYSGLGYASINKSLVATALGKTSSYSTHDTLKKIASIQSAMNRHVTDKPMTLYRGIDVKIAEKEIVAGKTLDALAFLSCTKESIGIAEKYTGHDGKTFKIYHMSLGFSKGVVYKLNVPKGTPAINLEAISNHPDEREVLLDNRLQLKVSTNPSMISDGTKNYAVYEVDVITPDDHPSRKNP